jgi:FdhD protein
MPQTLVRRDPRGAADPPRRLPLVTTTVVEWADGAARRLDDDLVTEEPLEIRVGEMPVSVTMRTPGHDLELGAGFLFTEGLLAEPRDLVSIDYALAPGGQRDPNVVTATTREAVQPRLAELERHFYASSSCGICGRASIEAVRRRGLRPPSDGPRIGPRLLCSLPAALAGAQPVFTRTGGLHAAALFDANGALRVLREDVGRHNAVDKVAGWALAGGRLPLSDGILLVSGRGGFEIVQKAVSAGVPVVACISAPSSLAVRLAREMGLTLVGFLRGRRFVVYAGEDRVVDGR